MKIRKKLLAVLLSLVLVIGLLPLSVSKHVFGAAAPSFRKQSHPDPSGQQKNSPVIECRTVCKEQTVSFSVVHLIYIFQDIQLMLRMLKFIQDGAWDMRFIRSFMEPGALHRMHSGFPGCIQFPGTAVTHIQALFRLHIQQSCHFLI